MAFWTLSGTLPGAVPTCAWALPTLPYTTRTKDFSGYSTNVQGDMRTLGMAGAMTGLADTYLASMSNPSGTAMTLPSLALQFNSNEVEDGYVQDINQVIKTYNYGFAGRPYPWGFSIGFHTPHKEHQIAFLPSTGKQIDTEVSIKEWSASIARVLFDDQLSIGLTTSLSEAKRSYDLTSVETTLVKYRVGSMWQFPNRILLGNTFTPAYSYPQGNLAVASTAPVSGLERQVHQPAEFSMGLGWIPNRIFRAGATVQWIGTTPRAATMADETRTVGQKNTFQPKLGINYTAIEFKEFKLFVMAGTYFETSRISGVRSRFHATGALDFNIWIFNIGWAVDKASQFQNDIYSFGVDLIRVAKKLELVPKGYAPQLKGVLPDPAIDSDDDLPKPLVRNYQEMGQTPDLIQIGTELPSRALKTFEVVTQDLKDVFMPSDDEEKNSYHGKHYPNRLMQ